MSLVVNDGFIDSLPTNVTVEVITNQDAASTVLMDTQVTINEVIPPEAFKNKNLGNALTNKINAALAMIQEGQYAQAYDKLVNDVLGKTNGCVETGTPDKNDWIKTCEEQALAYPLVMEAIGYLENLL